jgi:hypothetical protein
VSIGILSNKKEFDTLKGTLKQMENLVQDLQDELEMKEGLTVKELLNETSIEHDGKVSLYNILTTFLTHSDQLTKSFCILSADNRW